MQTQVQQNQIDEDADESQKREEKVDVQPKFLRNDPVGPIGLSDVCFFCDKSSKAKSLCNFESLEVEKKIRHIAVQLQDMKLIAKLSAGDMIAQRAKYHPKCLTALYNGHRRSKSMQTSCTSKEDKHDNALKSVVSHIEDVVKGTEISLVFKLSNL